MATALYEWWLSTDRGQRLAFLDGWLGFDYSLVAQNVGTCALAMPATFDLSQAWYKSGNYIEAREDRKLECWRQPVGGIKALENVYLLQDLELAADENGTDIVKLIGADGNHLIKRRTVRPGAAVAEYTLTDHADDVCKALVRYAMTDAADYVGRWIPPTTGGSTYFAVQADLHQGASFKKTYLYRTLMDACTAACKTSIGRGTNVYWGVRAVSGVQYQFQTYLDQIGADRRSTIVLSRSRNNLKRPVYRWSSMDSVNQVTALGAKMGLANYPEERYPGGRRDTARIGASIYALREAYVDGGSETSSATLRTTADEEMEKRSPKQTFTCELVDNENQRYGRDWGFGDRVTAEYRGMTFEPRVVKVTVSVGKTETIAAELSIPTASTREDT